MQHALLWLDDDDPGGIAGLVADMAIDDEAVRGLAEGITHYYNRLVDADSMTLNKYGRAACICGESVLPQNWPNHLLRQDGRHAAVPETAS
jgi:hypothetical protein